MSKYKLSIEFDSAQPRFTSGETVRGAVKVTARAACTCKALRLEVYWANDRSDPREEFSALKVDIFSGPLEVGEHRIPFEITMPQGPHSYRDVYIDVNWHLRATARIPMAPDPVDEVGFLLGPGPFGDPERYIAGDIRHNWVEKKRQGPNGAEPRVFINSRILINNALGILLVVGALYGLYDSNIIMGVFGILGAALLFTSSAESIRWIRSSMGLKELDKRGFRVEWLAGVVQPGDRIPIAIYLDNDDGISSVKATLVCLSRKHLIRIRLQKRVDDRLWESIRKEINYPLQKVARSTNRLHMQGEVKLPDEAAPVYYDEERQLLWAIDLRIQMDAWGEAQRRFFLDVRPASGDRWVGEPRRFPYEPVEISPLLEDMEQTHAW